LPVLWGLALSVVFALQECRKNPALQARDFDLSRNDTAEVYAVKSQMYSMK